MILHNLRMSESQKLQIEDAAAALNMSASALIRALLFDGVKRANSMASKDVKSTSDHFKLLDARAKL